MTGEHIFSAWIGRLFGNVLYQFTTLDKKGIYHRSASRGLNQKAYVVCKECNNGWMSDLEERQAKPTMEGMILHASPVSLLPNGISAIAAFAFKTAVVADCNRPSSGRPFFSHEVRRRFSLSLDIPRGVQIWLAALYRQRGVGGRFTTHYVRIENGRFKGFQFYAFTLFVGALVLQVTASRWVSIAKLPKFKPVLTQHPNWNRVAVPIWPNSSKAIDWPPSRFLNGETVVAFAERWSKLSEHTLC